MRNNLKKIKPIVVRGVGVQDTQVRAVREELSEGGGTIFQTHDCQVWKAPRVSEVSPCLQTQLTPSSMVQSQLAKTARGGSLNHSHHFPAPLRPGLSSCQIQEILDSVLHSMSHLRDSNVLRPHTGSLRLPLVFSCFSATSVIPLFSQSTDMF